MTYLLVNEVVKKMNKLKKSLNRFLDDKRGVWFGEKSDFSKFLVNAVGQKFGVQFTGECEKSVVFFDVESSTTEDGKIKTSMYVNTTDSKRYLNRRSYHSAHTFKCMSFSQFRRAVVCSNLNDRSHNVERINDIFHHVERMFSK